MNIFDTILDWFDQWKLKQAQKRQMEQQLESIRQKAYYEEKFKVATLEGKDRAKDEYKLKRLMKQNNFKQNNKPTKQQNTNPFGMTFNDDALDEFKFEDKLSKDYKNPWGKKK